MPTPAPTSQSPIASPGASPALDTSTPVPSCNLKCLNKGVCQEGAKDLGGLADIAPHVAELNQTFSPDFESCSCPDGFVGLQCEHEVVVCPGGEHLCLHGSKCIPYGSEYSCNCTASDSFTLAGKSCEHKSFVMCTEGDIKPVQPRSFCVNGGICRAIVSATEPHPGCECPNDNWDGPHCELSRAYLESEKEVATATSVSTEAQASSASGTNASNAILIIGILALVMSIVLSVYSHMRMKKERRLIDQERQLTAALTPHQGPDNHDLQYFKENETQNLAAGEPEVSLGPPRDEDGHELHQIELL